jgi:hypothetical protein
VIDPDKLAEFVEVIRAGGSIVCTPEIAALLRAAMPADVGEAMRDRIIGHPWCGAGELWAVYRGAVIITPTGAAAVAV